MLGKILVNKKMSFLSVNCTNKTIDLGSEKDLISAFGYAAGFGATINMSVSFLIQASNDNKNWTNIHSGSGYLGRGDAACASEVIFDNKKKFRYIKGSYSASQNVWYKEGVCTVCIEKSGGGGY